MPSDPIYRKEFKAQLLQALLEAFPDRATLREMVDLQFGYNLNAIASENLNLRATAHALITFAESRSKLRDLLAAAREANPDNELLKSLADQLGPVPRSVAVRRKAFHHPWSAFALLMAMVIAAVWAAGILSALMIADRDTVQAIEVVAGLLAASLVLWTMIRWRLKVHVIAASGAAVATVAGALTLPLPGGAAQSGQTQHGQTQPGPPPVASRTLSGRVFYEDSTEPAAGVVIVLPATNQMSAPTGADGAFTLAGIPPSTTWVNARLNEGEPIRLEIKNWEGGEYPRIPRPRSPGVDLPESDWIAIESVECLPPGRAFALRSPVPGRPDERTHLEVQLPSGFEFVNAMSRNRTSTPLSLSLSEQRRRGWVFSPQDGPIAPDLEVCVRSDSATPPPLSALHTAYWYHR